MLHQDAGEDVEVTKIQLERDLIMSVLSLDHAKISISFMQPNIFLSLWWITF